MAASDEPKVVPAWMTRPAEIIPIQSVDDFARLANEYFSECHLTDIRPTITGLALATGLPGPTSLLRLGQRVPELRLPISRCITAVAHEYEQMLSDGRSPGATFMLKNLPDFDPEDPEGSPAVLFFNDRKEISLEAEVYGAAGGGAAFENDDPIDVYLSILKNPVKTKQVTEKTVSKKTDPRPRLFQIVSEQ